MSKLNVNRSKKTKCLSETYGPEKNKAMLNILISRIWMPIGLLNHVEL